jgi:hypothetical protein
LSASVGGRQGVVVQRAGRLIFAQVPQVDGEVVRRA